MTEGACKKHWGKELPKGVYAADAFSIELRVNGYQ
jgi:hypothetical protein